MNCSPDAEKVALLHNLAEFYKVDTMADLIVKQDAHIKRLQGRIKFLEPKNNFIITKVREG